MFDKIFFSWRLVCRYKWINLTEKCSLIDKMGGSKKSLWVSETDWNRFIGFGGVSRSSWAVVRPGCWAARRPERWSRPMSLFSSSSLRNRQLQVTGDDTSLLVVPSGVSSQLQDLSRQILEHSGQIDRCTSTDTLGVVTFAEKPVNTTDGELQPCSGGAILAFALLLPPVYLVHSLLIVINKGVARPFLGGFSTLWFFPFKFQMKNGSRLRLFPSFCAFFNPDCGVAEERTRCVFINRLL